MSDILPPPPDPQDSRAFREWLYQVYMAINGQMSSFVLSMDTAGGLAARASAEAQAAALLAQDAALSQMRQVVEQQAGELAQIRAQVGELQKLAEQAALMASPQRDKPEPPQIRALMLMGG